LATILSSQEHKVIRVDYQPTSENMVIDFANRIASKLPSHIKLFKVRLNETATAYAEWYASDQE
jgi:6-pyruvoyltetrahydropterin/6-carboxytetrahydropterin synthase